MKDFLRLLPAVVSVSLLLVRYSPAQDDARKQYEAVRAQNCLVCAGHLPFHVKVAAQMFSLDGEPAGTGMVEEWWASPGRYRIETSGPEGQEVQTTDASATLPPVHRSNYLLRLLLDEAVNPMPPLDAEATVQIAERSFGSRRFRCFEISHRGLAKSSAMPLYCTEPDKMDMRVTDPSIVEGGVRNNIARFHNASVAYQTGIRFGDRQAISGEIKTLQALDPATSSYPELHPAPAVAEADKREALESAGVVAGHLLSRTMPKYPIEMRSGTPQGIVVLGIVVSRDGRVASLATLASPSPALSRAAEDAVRTWMFSPFTLDGKPVEALTDVVVSFAGPR